MIRALLLLALALAGCARKDAAEREFELWKELPHVFVAIDGDALAKQVAGAARGGIALRPDELELEYLTVKGGEAGAEGPLLRVYTREDRIPSGTTYVLLPRTYALSAAEGLQDSAGTCVDADARGACRATLDLEKTVKLSQLIHQVTNLEQAIPFEARRR